VARPSAHPQNLIESTKARLVLVYAHPYPTFSVDRHLNTLRAITAFIGALCVALLATPALADAGQKSKSFSDGKRQAPLYKVYTYEQPNGVPVFSDKAPANQQFSVMEFTCYACNPNSTLDWNAVALHTTEYATQISNAAAHHDVDAALIRAVIHAESGFNASARSRTGAIGLMQLMPGTAKELGVDPRKPDQNIKGGVAYLSQMLERFDGNIILATAAYNAGPNAVAKFNGIPPYPETRTYVERVKLLHKRYQATSNVESGS